MTNYTLADFMAGRPERIFSANKKPRILITWPHGDEELGPRFGYHMYKNRPDLLENVDYLCGNPKAAAKNVRFMESDLNRCFNSIATRKTYEERRAAEILEIISNGSYDYVIQLHTSASDTNRFMIIRKRTPVVEAMLAASPMAKVVVLPDTIARPGIMGAVPQAVEIEYNDILVSEPTVMAQVTKWIDILVGNLPPTKPRKREFFYVDRKVLKGEEPEGKVRNFKLCANDYYPVLFGYGPKAYKHDVSKSYFGFAATKKEEILL